MTPEFEIREWTPDDDPALVAGFVRAGGDERDGVDAIRTFGDGSRLVAVAPGGAIVGHLGAAWIPMTVRGEPCVFGRLAACFVDPGYRVGGLHSVLHALDETFRERFETPERMALLFGCWHEADWWHLRHRRDHEALTTSVDFVHAGGGTAGDPPADIVVTAGEFGAGDALRGLGACAAIRDAATVRRRAGNAAIWSGRRGGELVAHAAVRSTDAGRTIVDWALAGEDVPVGTALLRAIRAAAHTPIVARLWTARAATVDAFRGAGFRLTAGPERILSVRPIAPRINAQWLAEHWEVCLADVGAVANRPITVGEAIVVPPPAGTVTGRGRHGH